MISLICWFLKLDILHVISQDAEEYTQLPVRHNEDIINRLVNQKPNISCSL